MSADFITDVVSAFEAPIIDYARLEKAMDEFARADARDMFGLLERDARQKLEALAAAARRADSRSYVCLLYTSPSPRD